MKLFSNNIVPYTSIEGDKIYPIVVDIKKGIKSGEAISFVTADNKVGVITVDFMDGNSSYNIEGCMVTSTICRPDGTVLEIPCDIISQSTIEIPLGINGTYQEGVHTFDLKIVRGNGKVIGVPTMSYSVSGSISSDDVVEGDDRLPVLTTVLDNAQDKLTRLDKAIAGATNDLEVKEARDGEVTLNARLERDLKKGKIHFVDIEGSSISTDSEEGYLENVEIKGNTWQDSENLADIRSVGTKVEGQELYEIDVVSCGKNLFNPYRYVNPSFTFKNGMYSGNTSSYYVSLFQNGNGATGDRDVSKLMKIKKGNYFITFKSNTSSTISVASYDKDGKCIAHLGEFSQIKNISLDKDCYLDIRVANKGAFEVFDIQLEEGTVATPYESYQEDKLPILSPTPLEKVGDVADRIICKDGVWGVEKNIKTTKLKRTTTWSWYTNNLFKYCSTDIHITDSSSGYVMSDIGVNIWTNNVGTVRDYSTVDNIGYLNSLDSFIVKYPTTQPQFIPLPHSQQIKLKSFAEQTHIHFDTEIEPTIKASVPKSLGATVNSHTSQIDNLNKELDRVKKLEESTVSTVTSDKAFTTVSETSGGYFEDVKIEGKTLVNLADIQPRVKETCSDWYTSRTLCETSKLKLNEPYTLIIDCKYLEGHSYSYTRFELGIGNKINGFDSNIETTLPSFQIDMPTSGVYAVCLEFKDFKDMVYLAYRPCRRRNAPVEGEMANYDISVLLLEGDHTDKDLSYFEGLKSVGQDADEISVSSVNGGVDNANNKFIEIYFNTGVEESNLYCLCTGFNHISTDENVFLYRNGEKLSNSVTRRYYTKDKKYIGATITSDSFYVRYRFSSGSSTYEGNISEYEVKNSIECMEQDKKQILYYNPTTQTWEKPVLREWDSIEKHSDGKYYYYKRSEEVVLNGSESWKHLSMPESIDTELFYVDIPSLSSKTNNIDLFTDLIIPKIVYRIDEEGIYGDSSRFFIRALKSKLSTQDTAGFKAWLQANPVTVVYQLAQEEVYECTNLDLITYSGETNLIVNSGAIQPRITLKVLSNVSNVVKLLQEKVSVLENKFIKGLQQVLAGDMMSLAHLLYPEDFEHEIQTLES